jgi:hypothetical protein
MVEAKENRSILAWRLMLFRWERSTEQGRLGRVREQHALAAGGHGQASAIAKARLDPRSVGALDRDTIQRHPGKGRQRS